MHDPPHRPEAPATPPGRRLRRLLAVGGAPRSGTSMMLMALDGHPEIVAFPFEPSGMASVLTGREPPPVTKERNLADRQWLAQYVEAAVERGDSATAEFFRKFDAEAFGSVLRMGGGGNYAADLHRAFMTGIAPATGAYAKGDPIFAVKLPFFMEAAFPTVRGWAPDARLVHLSRAPVDRYLSCKGRAFPKGDMRPRGGIDYTTFHALLHRSSEASAAEHEQALSVKYEALVARPRETLEQVCAFLGIGWSDTLLEQTRWGAPGNLTSAYGFTNGASDDAERRRAGGLAISTAEERAYHEAVAGGDIEGARRHVDAAFARESPANHAARQALAQSLQSWIDEPARFRDLVLGARLSIL